MVKECSSGVQNPDFGEMECLALDKGWLYMNNFLVFSKFDKEFIYSHLMAKVNPPSLLLNRIESSSIT